MPAPLPAPLPAPIPGATELEAVSEASAAWEWWGAEDGRVSRRVAARSIAVASRCGLDVGALLEGSRATERRRVGLALLGRRGEGELVSVRGARRAARLLTCGRPSPAVLVAGGGVAAHGWDVWRCRDRLCPACAQRRGVELARAVREATGAEGWLVRDGELVLDTDGNPVRYDAATAEPGDACREPTIAFVTLTQPRRKGESLRDALARYLDSYQSAFSKGHRGSRCSSSPAEDLRASGLVLGVLRGVEATLSPLGWHVHGHLLVEIDPRKTIGQFSRRMISRWLAVSDGARAGAQCIRPSNSDRIYQVVKYAAKICELVKSDDIREFASTMAARRVVDGVGTLRGLIGRGKELLRAAEVAEGGAGRRVVLTGVSLAALGADDGVRLEAGAYFPGGEYRSWLASVADLRRGCIVRAGPLSDRSAGLRERSEADALLARWASCREVSRPPPSPAQLELAMP